MHGSGNGGWWGRRGAGSALLASSSECVSPSGRMCGVFALPVRYPSKEAQQGGPQSLSHRKKKLMSEAVHSQNKPRISSFSFPSVLPGSAPLLSITLRWHWEEAIQVFCNIAAYYDRDEFLPIGWPFFSNPWRGILIFFHSTPGVLLSLSGSTFTLLLLLVGNAIF